VPEQGPRQSFFICTNGNLVEQLQRFWEIEELLHKTWTTEEILYEEHFQKHTTQDDTGRFIVRFPQREGQGCLGESCEEAR
jgi:hypothetical protein